MRSEHEFFHCGRQLLDTLAPEISEIERVIAALEWSPAFEYTKDSHVYMHQAAYNRALAEQFGALGWSSQPRLSHKPRLIGDFQKGLVFVEVQFGNSAALYRDFYKFQYGLAKGLLSLAVLVVPSSAAAFFPTRPRSVSNMAEYGIAHTCLTTLPINVPTMLVGLLTE